MEAGRKFFSDGRSAGLSAAFQNQRLEPGFGEVKSCYQPIVAAADNNDVASHSHRLAGSIFQDFQRGQPSGRAHDAAAGMRCRAAHVKVLDGRAELRITWHRTQEEKLLKRKLSLKNIAFAQPELTLQVQRSEHL